jgi:putative Mn2+ efflux pump MntP
VLKVILLVLPLGLDTFAIGAALGIAGMPAAQRLRSSLLLAGFEGAMPLVGVLVGRGLREAIGDAATYLAIGGLALVGVFLLREGDDDDEAGKAQLLSRAQGWAILGLGIAVSLDELAIGVTVGLLRLPLVWIVVLVAAQAFVAAQIGIRLGRRLGERFREGAERLAGVALVLLAAGLLAEQLLA